MIDLHQSRFGRIAAAASALGLGLVLPATPAFAQTMVFEYSAKAICGELSRQSDILAGGRYFTVVNVHNPGPPATLRRKVATAGRGSAGHVSPFENMQLRNDEALHIDCRLIHRQADSSWVEGFLVIQSTHQLDVVAVYTTAEGGAVRTFHTDRVPMRRIVP